MTTSYMTTTNMTNILFCSNFDIKKYLQPITGTNMIYNGKILDGIQTGWIPSKSLRLYDKGHLFVANTLEKPCMDLFKMLDEIDKYNMNHFLSTIISYLPAIIEGNIYKFVVLTFRKSKTLVFVSDGYDATNKPINLSQLELKDHDFNCIKKYFDNSNYEIRFIITGSVQEMDTEFRIVLRIGQMEIRPLDNNTNINLSDCNRDVCNLSDTDIDYENTIIYI